MNFPRSSCVAVAVSPLLLCQITSGDDPVTIDGVFNEWTEEHLYWDDGVDSGLEDADFLTLSLRDDPNHLQMRIDFRNDFDLSENNDVILLIDTDGNPSTGLQTEGIGAELRFVFGDREGRFYTSTTNNQNQGEQIWHSDLYLQGAPTVTSTSFEVSIDRDRIIDGEPVFPGNLIRIVIMEQNGDRMPDQGAISFQFDQKKPPTDLDLDFEREMPDDVRLLSWNVLNDSMTDNQDEPRFRRIIQSLSPDVINFQEIYDRSSAQVMNQVKDWIDPAPGDTWHHAGNNDCKTVSRFPVLHSEPLGGNLVVLLDTTKKLERTLLVINAHTPCCSNDSGRQWEIDQMMSFIGRVRKGNHQDIPADCAVEITGDMNLVGLAQQLESLIDGNIINESEFGTDVQPDVDGSNLLDVMPTHTGQRMSYTWRNDNSGFWPGRLDFTVISDSVLEVGRSFAVETRAMTSQRLQSLGLNSADSSASDHLALVCDVRPPSDTTVSADLDGDGFVNGSDLGLLFIAWNSSNPAADLDGDGIVGGGDIGVMLLAWTG